MSGPSYEMTLYEVHTSLDLDGFEDMDMNGEPSGLRVPYIVTILESTGDILAIRRNYDQNDMLMRVNNTSFTTSFARTWLLRLWPDPHDWRVVPSLYKHPTAAY